MLCKKLVILLVCTSTILPLSAQENYGENYTGAIGFSFNNVIDKDFGNLGALGINFGGYTFFNHKYNVGLYNLTTLNFPLAGRDAYDGIFLYDQTLAAGFRHKFSSQTELLYSAGPHLSVYSVRYKAPNTEQNISAGRTNVGVAVDIGIKLNSKSTIGYIIVGVNVGCDFFASGGTARNDGYHKRTAFDYYSVGIKPYIMLGTNARVFEGLLGSGKEK
jgi:hypothetical protein